MKESSILFYGLPREDKSAPFFYRVFSRTNSVDIAFTNRRDMKNSSHISTTIRLFMTSSEASFFVVTFDTFPRHWV